ncbi:MAG: hypothetical protein KGQ66_09145 [Acidobacteriota bacterium]|nr:hypothetical protein [Acidobacteriota bacterium]
MNDIPAAPHNDGAIRTIVETPEEIAFQARAAEGAVWTASRLLLGIAAFAFASLGFAYFYLRSTNNQDLWRPGGVTASMSFGIAILVFAAGTALLSTYGTWRWGQGHTVDSEVAGWITVLGGCLALGIQTWQLFELHFYPGSSGYSSCFIAWAVMNIALLLTGVYWTETMLVRSLRIRRAISDDDARVEEALAPANEAAAYPVTTALTEIEVVVSNHYWVFIGLVNVVFWLMFYVI